MTEEMWEQSSEGLEALQEVRERRGFTLPLHEVMASVDPEILRRYNALAAHLIFGPEPRALDLKTRFLVLVGITAAVKVDTEGVEWSSQRAMEHGATEKEVLEAILLSSLPAGMPAAERAVTSLIKMRSGEGLVKQDPTTRASDAV